MKIYHIKIHGHIKATANNRETAEQWLKEHGCDGSHDGRCADWRDSKGIWSDQPCNEITEDVLL